MTTTSKDAEAASWHRRFAAQCNNRAWELSVQKTRSAAQDREMLDAAHASAWHWALCGDELNRMRATTLLAEVHALLGMGPSALAFAESMRDYYRGHPPPDWELAITHAIHAHAAHAAGRSDEHRESWARAEAALAAIASDEDRRIVSATFAQVPRP